VLQQRKDFEGAELAEMKDSAWSYLMNYYWKEGVTAIETINGKDTYAIKDGKTIYYDVNTGLKLADAKTMEQGKLWTQLLLDYREVKGVKVPFNIIQNVGFELDIKMSEVKSTKALRMLILNN
jgi:hypothetical protein